MHALVFCEHGTGWKDLAVEVLPENLKRKPVSADSTPLISNLAHFELTSPVRTNLAIHIEYTV